jgi:hypothetical protein
MPSPKLVFLHGLGSSPGSRKGVGIAAHFARRGVEVARLDLRVPSLERLSLRRMLEVARDAIGGPRDRAVLIGSSLGGLTAARLAEDEPRVCALALLAPALRFERRWRERLGEGGWERWLRDGAIDQLDHATGRTVRLHAGFAVEAAEVDAPRGDDPFPDVRVPTLVLHGRADDVVPVEGSREFAATRPHVRLVELDDDHELTSSLPAICAELERFLAPVIGAPG